MLLRLLAFADLLSVISLIGSSILPEKLIILMGIYLIIKGLYFTIIGGPFPSTFDILSGIYIILAAFSITNIILTIAVIIFLLQKSIISFL